MSNRTRDLLSVALVLAALLATPIALVAHDHNGIEVEFASAPLIA